LCRGTDLLLPVVGLHDDVKEWRAGRIADLDNLDLDPEKVDVLAGVLVKPIEGLAVLGSKRRGYPDDRGGGRARRVGQHLPEVRMICPRELVLDDEDRVVSDVSADEIQPVAADGVLGGLEFEFEPECFC
jgi:hypothetical protein